MKFLVRVFAVLALILVASNAGTQTPTRRAAAGEGATGEVVREEADELQLDTTPCGASRSIVSFRKPYSKEAAGSINCGGTVKQLVQAVQS